MKEFGMMCKRCMSMFLAVVLLLSCVNIGGLLPIRAVESEKKAEGETVTLGVLIKENFDGLSEEEISAAIRDVFVDMFSEPIDKSLCDKMAREIIEKI